MIRDILRFVWNVFRLGVLVGLGILLIIFVAILFIALF